MRDLIFISMEDWDDVWRRNQFLCAGLARRHPDMKILFVGLERNVSNDLRYARLSSLAKPATDSPPHLPNIRTFKPLKLFPNSYAPTRLLNEAHFRRQVAAEARSFGLRAPILWLNPHYAVHTAGRMNESAVLYDITDDWTQLTQSPAARRLVERQDAALCRRADATIVCSQKLFDLKRPLARQLHLIPNGVNAEHYAAVTEPGPLPDFAARWPHPVIGYTGSIHPDRVDLALIERLAQSFPTGTIALVGPNMLPRPDRACLARYPNIHLTGPVPYHDLPNSMRAFDVCMTPHRMTPFTESLNPIKLWEYLAAGKPIVSTNVAGFRDYPALVSIASTPDDFLAAVHAALAEGLFRLPARRGIAASHSWDARLDAVETILDSLAPAASPAAAHPGREVACAC